MSDNAQTFWEKALESYSTKDWIDKPTIFVQQVVQYFPPNGKILELAAGQGQDSRYLAARGYEVVCTDRSEYGLQQAERKAKSEKLDITFKKVDLSQPLPFKDNEFDIVYSHLGLHYFTKDYTRQLFQEIHRVLKQGGILAALFNTPDDPELKDEGFEKIEDNYFLEIKTGLKKRYLTLEDAKYFIDGIFEPIAIDNEGRAYKDGKTALVRIIAKSILR